MDGTNLGSAEQLARSAPPGSVSPSVRPTSPPPADGAIWHIAVGETTQGPYTLEELREYYAEGSVLLDTLVFREGWPDWRPAGDVGELSSSARSAQSSLPVRFPSQTGAAALAGAVSMGSDPFADRSALSSPRLSTDQMMAPGGHESTVQFSLDQMRALSSASAPAAVSMPIASSSVAAGHAAGDGSGLIDVRKLAELHAQMSTSRPEPASEASGFSGLVPTGSYAHTLSPLSLPLAPKAAAPTGIDGRTKLVAGLAAFGMALAGGVAVFAILRTPVQGSEVAEGVSATPTATAAAAPAHEATLALAAAAPEEAAPEAETAAEPAPREERNAAADTNPRSTRPKGSKARRGSKGEPAEPREPKPSKASEPIAKAEKTEKADSSSKGIGIDELLGEPVQKKGGSPSIDELLDGAVSGKKSAPKAAEAAPSSDLPQTPSRDAMKAALAKAAARASKCPGSGVGKAAITVSGNGRVSSVAISGVEGPGTACAEKAFRSASFPKFQKESFDVAYPFKLKG